MIFTTIYVISFLIVMVVAITSYGNRTLFDQTETQEELKKWDNIVVVLLSIASLIPIVNTIVALIIILTRIHK